MPCPLSLPSPLHHHNLHLGPNSLQLGWFLTPHFILQPSSKCAETNGHKNKNKQQRGFKEQTEYETVWPC